MILYRGLFLWQIICIHYLNQNQYILWRLLHWRRYHSIRQLAFPVSHLRYYAVKETGFECRWSVCLHYKMKVLPEQCRAMVNKAGQIDKTSGRLFWKVDVVSVMYQWWYTIVYLFSRFSFPRVRLLLMKSDSSCSRWTVLDPQNCELRLVPFLRWQTDFAGYRRILTRTAVLPVCFSLLHNK